MKRDDQRLEFAVKRRVQKVEFYAFETVPQD